VRQHGYLWSEFWLPARLALPVLTERTPFLRRRGAHDMPDIGEHPLGVALFIGVSVIAPDSGRTCRHRHACAAGHPARI